MNTREHLRIVAVIQARMGSTRLPGKVLKAVAGKPLLWHIVHRLRASRLIEEIAIATSVDPRDDAIVAFGAEQGIAVIRGPEENVLARFARAAEMLDADIIVRVNADAPFIDAVFIDHLVASLIEQQGDYVLMEEGAVCAHEGVDPFTRRALDKLMMDASADPAAREHVTGYFKLHPGFVRIARAAPYPALARDAGRLTIDTEDDLAFVEAVHERMNANAGEASLADLLALLEREPGLRAINAHVRQKPIAPPKPIAKNLALIACDGGGKFGYGHVKRMLALARALGDRENIAALFAVNGTNDARALVARAGFEVADAPLTALIERNHPQILVLDGREGPSRSELATLARNVAVTAVIDDASERRLAVTRAYYPPVKQVEKLDWTGAATELRIGWEWALTGLPPQKFSAAPARGSRPTLLVAMGGSDPAGLTLRAARALGRLEATLRVRFVVGQGMKDARRTAAAIVAMRGNFETVEGADDLSTEYASADIALCAFGVTANELAAFGVPAIYLGLTADHTLSAQAFDDAGMGISLGEASMVPDEAILAAVKGLLGDGPRRRAMRTAGLATIDGNGAVRIAADLAAAVAEIQTSIRSAL